MNDDWFISVCHKCGSEKHHDPLHPKEKRRGTVCRDCGAGRVVVENGQPIDSYPAE